MRKVNSSLHKVILDFLHRIGWSGAVGSISGFKPLVEGSNPDRLIIFKGN